MENINTFWLYPIIIIAGCLQAYGPPMNGALHKAIANPWLASIISFIPIVAVLSCVFFCLPKPLPTVQAISGMPWWAPLGGLIGAVAVIVGLMFVNKVGAGTLAGLTITANFLMSILIDNYGWFGVTVHPINWGRVVGSLLLIGGIYLVSKF